MPHAGHHDSAVRSARGRETQSCEGNICRSISPLPHSAPSSPTWVGNFCPLLPTHCSHCLCSLLPTPLPHIKICFPPKKISVLLHTRVQVTDSLNHNLPQGDLNFSQGTSSYGGISAVIVPYKGRIVGWKLLSTPRSHITEGSTKTSTVQKK